MKIKDIPFPALIELAMKQQELQGNAPDEDKRITEAFDWAETKQGYWFWVNVCSKEFEKARGIYDWDKSPQEPEFNEQEFMDKCAIAAMQALVTAEPDRRYEYIVNDAYDIAEAMLGKRKEALK